jgi:hypothetical protein
MRIALRVAAEILWCILRLRIGLRRWCGGGVFRIAALDNLVEFAAIKPDAAALRAIVDLDALPVAASPSFASIS